MSNETFVNSVKELMLNYDKLIKYMDNLPKDDLDTVVKMSAEMMVLSSIKDNIIDVADNKGNIDAISSILTQVVKLVENIESIKSVDSKMESIDEIYKSISKMGSIDDIVAVLGKSQNSDNTKTVEYIAKLIKELYDGNKPVGNSLKLEGKSLEEIKAELIKANQITQTENANKLDNNSLSDVIQKSMQHTISTLKNSESEYIDFSIIANKLRELIDSNNQLKQKSESISQILQSDDVNLDSLQEIVSFIKSNKDNIDATTIGGKSLDDIKNELLSNTSASGFDYESDTNPTTSTNPTKQSAKWLNTSTAELFVCTDNTTDNNIWRGSNNSLVKVMPYVGFETTLYTGNGTSQEIVSKSINSGVDFVWIKSRTTTDGNLFVDSLRGINNNIDVFWDLPHFSREQYVTNATNNSFTVGSDEDVNKAGASYVACMATLPNHNPSNTDGTITTESRSNSFMSIAKFLSTTNDNESVGHGLGTKPELTILKTYTSASRDWIVFGEVLGEGKYLSLNKTDSLTNRPNYYLPATDKVINLGPKDFAQISHTANFLLYSFVSVEGMCKIGTIDGPSATIETGFETQFLLIKNIDSSSDWFIIDNQRGTDKAIRTNSAKPEVVNPFGNPYAVTFKADSITLADLSLRDKYLYMAIAKGAM
jgi:hypothetical protein